MPYSHREDFVLPAGAKKLFYQPFSMEAWQASNFAPEQSVEWFRDARYGMFIHFGLSTYLKRDLSWEVCHTRKAPDCGTGPVPDEEWQSWAGNFALEPISTGEQSLFSDEGTFGTSLAEGVTVRASSLEAPRPSIEWDLGEERLVTGVRVELAESDANQAALTIMHSLDADQWHEAGTLSDPVSELPINGYRAGAWQPGGRARYIRIEMDRDDPAVLALAHCAVYVKAEEH